MVRIPLYLMVPLSFPDSIVLSKAEPQQFSLKFARGDQKSIVIFGLTELQLLALGDQIAEQTNNKQKELPLNEQQYQETPP